jgi:hypothetical protein
MKMPSCPPWTTRFETPFQNQSPDQIAQTQDMLSDMSKSFWFILDPQTLEDKRVCYWLRRRGDLRVVCQEEIRVLL